MLFMTTEIAKMKKNQREENELADQRVDKWDDEVDMNSVVFRLNFSKSGKWHYVGHADTWWGVELRNDSSSRN
jgi:hypothetical protein